MARLNRAQVLKQADVVMLQVLFPDRFSAEAKLRNWEFYEPRTTHDSSLSPSMHALAASDLDLPDTAYAYFRRSAFIDLHDLMGNSATGLHLAALGGTWQAVVRGFLGLRLEGSYLRAQSRLPASWKKVSMLVRYRRRWYTVEVTHDSAQCTRLRSVPAVLVGAGSAGDAGAGAS